jgi:hypothetical protein
MTQKPDPHAGNASTTGRPDNWDGDEMRPGSSDETETPPDDENEKVPIWNERQMAGQRADGSRTPGPSDEEIESSKGGLSGGGANPGGGERWAKRDVEPVED